MVRRLLAAGAAATLVLLGLQGCAGGGDSGADGTPPPPTPSSSSPSPTGSASPVPGNGAILVQPRGASGALRYPIGADGAVGAGAEVPWESGPDAEATLLLDALGPWALTRTIELPLTDVSATLALQVRDVVSGEVLHALDVPGWCSGGDGASYPCLLLDETRIVRTTPITGEHDGTITISSIEDGRTLAEFGPFPALAGVNPTSSPDALNVVTSDGSGSAFRFLTLDTRTGVTNEIGTIPVGQAWLCRLGTDSVLTYTSTLTTIGPARVAPVEVPELTGEGPGAEGCSADGAFLYVRTGDPRAEAGELVIDRVSLADGSRAAALTLTSREASIAVTR
jgi:hypothetical protein